MGCMCSKAIDVRSMSIREKPKPGTWEELLASQSSGRGDKLFSFICSASAVTTKLRSSSFTLPSGCDHHQEETTSGAAKKWDLISDINQKFNMGSAPSGGAVGESNFEKYTRSKSCQGLGREEEMLLQDSESDRLNGSKIGWKDKNLTGSRSFHTVEEYDALLERIYRFSTRDVDAFGDNNLWENQRLQHPNSLAEDQNERSTAEDHQREEEPGVKEGINDGSSSERNHDNFGDVVQANNGTGETGWKRRSVAKGLKSLDVSTIEFPAIARFRQRWNYVEGQVYSPGSYITPKFGSYNSKVTPAREEKEHGENGEVFTPELLAAFEDCMQQLQEDEDSILSHMDEISQVGNVMENQAEEDPTKQV